MTDQQWKEHVDETSIMRSRPGERGEVSVYRRELDGELRFDHIEWPDGRCTA
jgi:hypothetical protein